MLVCVLVSFGWIFAPIECQAWWDPDYAYRRQLTIDAAVYGYSVKLVLTGAEAADIYNKSLPSGDDFRVAWYDSSVWTDLDRELESFTSSNITVWFRIQEPAGWAGGLSNYYLYYGNASPAAVKADRRHKEVARQDRRPTSSSGGSPRTWTRPTPSASTPARPPCTWHSWPVTSVPATR